ncbi:ATP-binding protein [Streptomyces sp. NPDC002690]
MYDAPLRRPEREELLGALAGIGAVVVVDDLEFGGAALEELLDATPECAFLFGTTPDVAADTELDEVSLAGLSRAAATDLLGRVAGRPLTDEESNWSGDLWFESEGLPLRFVQAGALLRQRDQLREIPEDFDEYGAFEERPAGALPVPLVPVTDDEVPLPSIGEAAAPALLLASRLSEAAREALRYAVALGGEVPHQAHLPALIGHTHADAALGELAGVGLLSPAGSRYRLAAGVQVQLELGGYAEGAEHRALTVAEHYAWWVKHPSVTPARAVAEADAVLAAMAVLLPGGSPEAAPVVVRLARSAGPAFAAALHWGAWEKALRVGQEASRLSGEVAEEAYFHHELGVLALCAGHLDRARAELEASIGLRGALADRSGAVAGRRALALVTDRSGALSLGAMPDGAAADTATGARGDGAVTQVLPALPPLPALPRQTLVADEPAASYPVPAAARGKGGRPTGVKALGRTVVTGARRNLVAVGAGALLVAVLGTVVTLGVTAGSEDAGNQSVTPGHSAEEGDEESTVPAEDTPAGDDGSGSSSAPTGSTSVRPGTSGTPTPDATGTPTPGSSGTAQSPDPATTSPTASDTGSAATKPPSGGSSSTSTPPKGSPTGSTPAPSETSGDPSATPTTEPPSTGESPGGDGGGSGDDGGVASATASGTAEASPWGSPGTATATPDGA